MGPIEIGRKRLVILFATIAIIFLLYNIGGSGLQDNIKHIPIPGHPEKPESPYEPFTPDNEADFWDDPPERPQSQESDVPSNPTDHAPSAVKPTETADSKNDLHPISQLMEEADEKWRIYEGSRSETFRQTVEKYRSKYGRHPPPGFKEWYQFARKRNVWNIDDFDQIMDDLRPFWAIDPKVIRSHAAHMWENPDDGVSGIHIRKNKVVKVHHEMWRTDTMVDMINKFIEYLPDMDICMNRLDQPRVVVPWEEMQAHLDLEYKTRAMPPETANSFTTNQQALLNTNLKETDTDDDDRYDAEWFGAPGKQYMDIAAKACPPESPARANLSISEADALYKEPLGGIVTNFNLSSDLCTVGPAIHNLHGMLYSASSIIASHKLVPIFGECKVNINSDILFPANMYYRHDERYDYSELGDVPWREKDETMIWRGVTSGGVQVADNWSTMHRQRLVQLTNGTHMWIKNREVTVLTQGQSQSEDNDAISISSAENTTYASYTKFLPSSFASSHTDVGFVESWGCVPDCSFYDTVFSYKPQTTLTSQFKSKYLIDVDGHSFSGRWHAFLQSKSLGLKATIFREWHDSRLLAWRHFVPVDNRYDDLYSLLTYFIGYGTPDASHESEDSTNHNPNVYIASHDAEAKQLARQGREWANKVLRRDDIEVYMFRLLLEYGRVIDDNRDRIGYSGDGTELDSPATDSGSRWGIASWLPGKKKPALTGGNTTVAAGDIGHLTSTPTESESESESENSTPDDEVFRFDRPDSDSPTR